MKKIYISYQFKFFSSIHQNKSDIDQKKRSKLFHVRVIFKNTKVDTLFDSRYQVNLISKVVFKKLELKMTPHKNLYPLGWVCDDANLKVTM
jgi:hypothetical protein